MKARIASFAAPDAREEEIQRTLEAIDSGESETLKTLVESSSDLINHIRNADRLNSPYLVSFRELQTPLSDIREELEDLVAESAVEPQKDRERKVRCECGKVSCEGTHAPLLFGC